MKNGIAAGALRESCSASAGSDGSAPSRSASSAADRRRRPAAAAATADSTTSASSRRWYSGRKLTSQQRARRRHDLDQVLQRRLARRRRSSADPRTAAPPARPALRAWIRRRTTPNSCRWRASGLHARAPACAGSGTPRKSNSSGRSRAEALVAQQQRAGDLAARLLGRCRARLMPQKSRSSSQQRQERHRLARARTPVASCHAHAARAAALDELEAQPALADAGFGRRCRPPVRGPRRRAPAPLRASPSPRSRPTKREKPRARDTSRRVRSVPDALQLVDVQRLAARL